MPAMTGREIGLASRWMIVPSSISGAITPVPAISPSSGSMVPMAKVCMSEAVALVGDADNAQQDGQADQRERQQQQQQDPAACPAAPGR